MSDENPQRRPMEGWYLRDGLKRLAEISVIANGLQRNLEPLSAEDLELGALPLSQEQIAGSIDRIQHLITSFVLEELRATPEEWYRATDAIE